jgi:heme/copper-type cytochrome/quinol oxidase subunit 2
MKFALISLIILAAIGFYAYSSTRPTPELETAVTLTPQPESTSPQTATESDLTQEVMVIDVEAGSFYYTPDTITVKKGQPVKIVMTSVDMMHDFVIDELNVKLPIVRNGDTGEIEFTPDTVGEFEYFCSVADHRA